jgi:arginine decarboxylase
MGRVRIVWGSATGPTALGSYDAALAAANVHEYNLRRVSSVLPAETVVESVGTAPDLGAIGGALTVVESRRTVERTDERACGPTDESGSTDPIVCAGLGWTQAESGRGIVYEATGIDPTGVHERIEAGLESGTALREFTPVRTDRLVLVSNGWVERVETARTGDRSIGAGTHGAGDRQEPGTIGGPDRSAESHLTSVVLALYGESEPVF